MNKEVLKKLYESAVKVFDMPAYEQFVMDMSDEQKIIKFRESMSKYYEIPDIETFKTDIGFVLKKKDSSEVIGDQEPMAVSYTHLTLPTSDLV